METVDNLASSFSPEISLQLHIRAPHSTELQHASSQFWLPLMWSIDLRLWLDERMVSNNLEAMRAAVSLICSSNCGVDYDVNVPWEAGRDWCTRKAFKAPNISSDHDRRNFIWNLH